MAVVTSVVFGARWGPAAPVALLCVLTSLSVVSLTALVITSARTERQAEGLASIIVFALALLGGNFVALSRESDWLRRLALLTPNGWALRGFTDLSTDAGAGAVVRPALAIAVFTVVVGVVALARARKTLVT
jgi:ABC-2 type transport system permease protein